ncbi:MAG: 30S ribosomal protein S2 [Candidatus Moranbacteria bacterium]|nr:30S ribosomal protein S2 [Candidatus Moranbacteria bacterium]
MSTSPSSIQQEPDQQKESPEEQLLEEGTLELIKKAKDKKIDLEDLLKMGVHFGHQKSKWNPKMRKFIYTMRNGVRIFDLAKTKEALIEATAFMKEKKGDGQILFVGTKRQANDIVKTVANYLDMPYVTERWLGGTLTNFKTLRSRIDKLIMVEKLQEKGELKKYTKKEQGVFKEKLEKFNKRMGGIKNMKELPKVVFVVDLISDKIAVDEANKMNIPVVGIADANADPTKVDLAIPANDDAVGSIKFILTYIAANLK